MIGRKPLRFLEFQVPPRGALAATSGSPAISSKLDREGRAAGAAFLRLRVVEHLEGASDQLLAEVHVGAFHEGQAISVNHHSGPALFKYPVVGVDHCVQRKSVLESGASTPLHLQPEEFCPLGDLQEPLDAAVGEVNLAFVSLGAGGRRFPKRRRSGGRREEPATRKGRTVSPRAEGHLATPTWTASRHTRRIPLHYPHDRPGDLQRDCLAPHPHLPRGPSFPLSPGSHKT